MTVTVAAAAASARRMVCTPVSPLSPLEPCHGGYGSDAVLSMDAPKMAGEDEDDRSADVEQPGVVVPPELAPAHGRAIDRGAGHHRGARSAGRARAVLLG